MKIEKTALAGILVITPDVYRDSRGVFLETWNLRSMTEAGLPSNWVQDNFSLSKKNVVRGIHYQISQPQGKLVRVTHGAAFDIAVDLRRSSPTYGEHIALELDGESGRMLWIPAGFGHAFLAATDVVGFAYKVTDYYSPASERTIVWNDPDLAIPWPIDEKEVIVSAKDQKGAPFREAEMFA